jgi:Arc/MetJ-type ribon-helix-helix transcriptional regulator
MCRHNVTPPEPVSEMVCSQVKSGRYKDLSAALHEPGVAA